VSFNNGCSSAKQFFGPNFFDFVSIVFLAAYKERGDELYQVLISFALWLTFLTRRIFVVALYRILSDRARGLSLVLIGFSCVRYCLYFDRAYKLKTRVHFFLLGLIQLFLIQTVKNNFVKWQFFLWHFFSSRSTTADVSLL